MKNFVKIIICIATIAVIMSVMAFPAFATRLPTVIKPLETMAPTGSSGTTTGLLPGKRPIISLTPTTEPPESSETPSPSFPSKRPIIPLTPTTEPESDSSSAAPSRPLRGEENLIPTTESSSGNTGSSVTQRPIKGEENLVPTTPSQKPSGMIQKPTTSGTTSSATSTVQPTESATKPTEAAKKPTASQSQSPFFTKHPTGETIKEGANAQFVAIAENADSYNWIILSADGKETYSIKEACSHFEGVKAEGSVTTRLTLYYIPASLNGYYIACIAEGNGETVTSNGAILTIQSNNSPVQVKETAPGTEPATEPATEAAETTGEIEQEATVAQISGNETVQSSENIVSATEEQSVEEESKPATGLYLIGGICIALFVVAIILMIILLKTLRKGKRR